MCPRPSESEPEFGWNSLWLDATAQGSGIDFSLSERWKSAISIAQNFNPRYWV